MSVVAALVAASAVNGATYRIGIEAGHTESTVGAVSCDGRIIEADITLAVSLKTAQILRAAGYLVDVFRDGTQGTRLKSEMNGYKADAFVALHTDYCAGNNTGFKVSRYGGHAGSGLNQSGDADDRLVESFVEAYRSSTGLAVDTSPGHYTRQMTYYWGLGAVADDTPGAIIEMGWLSGDASFMASAAGQQKMAFGIALGIERFVLGQVGRTPTMFVRTATVLVMDTSGSMGERWENGRKLDSAKEAALQFISHVEQENLAYGTEHWIGIVGFSSDARVLLPLTNNYGEAKRVIISMSSSSATNLGAGLTQGLQEVSRLPSQAQRYVTILSDGNTNTGLSKNEILSGPVSQARRAKICLNTVAFGDRNDVDESFLRRVASPLLGCGRYEYAATGFDLFAAYIKIRHHALGQVISGLSSFGHSVTPLVGMSIPLGTISIPSGQHELQITLGWSEQGTLQLKLYDPAGRQVSSSYPGARIYSSGRFAQAMVTSPQAGIWRVEALPLTSMPQGTQYFAIGSIRPGGITFALPLPVFTIGDRTFALPGNMPTWALVLVSVVCIAVGLWQLLTDAGLL
ncbi:VWA domain-containing protein [Candidatus Bipolaricaulota bacterium]